MCTLLCRVALGAECDNPAYRRQNPYKCALQNNSAIALGGIAALGAGALAVAAASGGGGGGSGGGAMPTIQTYDSRGADVNATELAGIINTAPYAQNAGQYNDIRLAYSIARGYSGATSHIAVLDNGENSWHGKNVARVAADMAPGAKITQHKITDASYEFLPYGKIGEIIQAEKSAHIFNASWSVSMRATDIRNRHQLELLTDRNFISALTDGAGRDAIFVWAAGNDGAAQSSALSAIPRVIPEMQGHFINVVAWDSATGRLADYSNACGVTMDYCITAPGTDITADNAVVSGTSFAAPIVSAAVATLRQAFPYMTSPQITSLLFETARDIGAPGVDAVYGHGMLDMERATRPVGTPTVPIGGEMMAPLRAGSVPAQIAHNLKNTDIKFAYFDKYGRAFETRLSDHISAKNPSRAMDRLRGEDSMNMVFGPIEMGFRSNDFVIGEGLLKAERRHTIGYIGLRTSAYIGNTTIKVRANIGQSRPRPTPESMISEFSSMYNLYTSIKIERAGWFAAIAAPDTILRGNMTLRTPMARRADGAIIFTDQTADISTRPAPEYTIGYKFLSATFVDNPYGTDEIFLMAKSKLIF